METANTLQIIDATELTTGSHESFNLDADLILGQRTIQTDDTLTQALMEGDLIATAPSVERAAGGKQKPLTLIGTDNNDVLVGKTKNDKIYGEGGDDTLIGGKGNDLLVGGGHSGTYDQMTGGKGNDTFSLVTASNEPGYQNDDQLDSLTAPRGFALINDFKVGQDRIQLSGEAAHYLLVPAERFGSATKGDTAIIYQGPEQDKSELVGIIKDVSLNNSFLNIPQSFTYVS